MSRLEEKRPAVSKKFPPSGNYRALKSGKGYIGPYDGKGDIFELELEPESESESESEPRPPAQTIVVDSSEIDTADNRLKSNRHVNLGKCSASLGDKPRFNKSSYTHKKLSVIPLYLLIRNLFSMKESSSMSEPDYTRCITVLFYLTAFAVSQLHEKGVANLNLNENTIVIRQDGSILLEFPESAKKLDKGGASPRISPEEKKDISSLGNLLCFLLLLKKFKDDFSVDIQCEKHIQEELASNNYMNFFPIVLPLLKGGQKPSLLLEQNFWEKQLDKETIHALMKGGNLHRAYPDAFFAALGPLMEAKQAEIRAAIKERCEEGKVPLTITPSAI